MATAKITAANIATAHDLLGKLRRAQSAEEYLAPKCTMSGFRYVTINNPNDEFTHGRSLPDILIEIGIGTETAYGQIIDKLRDLAASRVAAIKRELIELGVEVD